jgi:hypothetical protein
MRHCQRLGGQTRAIGPDSAFRNVFCMVRCTPFSIDPLLREKARRQECLRYKRARTLNERTLRDGMREDFWYSAGSEDRQRETTMKRIVVLALLVGLSGLAMPAWARGGSPADDTQQSATDKEELKKQKALAKYQRAQEKAQAKAQRKEDKRQRKAAEKYEKEQRKLLKASSHPQKQSS